MKVCVKLLRLGYGVDEIWMTVTDSANAISEEFFAKPGEQAEADLDRIICAAHDTVARSEPEDQYSRFAAEHVSNADPNASTT